MLAHLHHTPRVRPHYSHWARDAVIAAQVGAAALIVVTALEHTRRDSDRDAQQSTLARTTVEQVAPAATPTTTATTVIDLRQGAAPITTTPAPAASVSIAAVGTEPVETMPSVGVLTAPSALSGRIDIAVEHGGTASNPLPTLTQDLFGPVRVEVLGADNATVATASVAVGEVGRIEGLPAGRYRLVLSTETPMTEPAPGVAIGAANSQLTSEVELAEGDVLLVAPQANPTA